VELSAPEVADLSPDGVAVLPIGAIEQHGPHLPLITDLLVAESLARDAVNTWGDAHDLWLLPSLACTTSTEHAWAPGTLWLSAATMTAVVDDLGRSVAKTPLGKLVFLNGHRGNSALLEVCARELRLNYGLATFVTDPACPPPDADGLAHGGKDETSVVLHLRPDLVDLTRARYAVPDRPARYDRVKLGRTVQFGWLSDDLGADGTVGDPALATAEHGKVLYEGMLAATGEALGEIASFSPRPLPS